MDEDDLQLEAELNAHVMADAVRAMTELPDEALRDFYTNLDKDAYANESVAWYMLGAVTYALLSRGLAS